jgi:phosphoribosylaminoimidazole (AIR) synthetase
VLPAGVDAHIELGSWPVPPMFRLVREITPGMPIDELYRTLNMGIGMVIVCAPHEVEAVRELIDEPVYEIGRLVQAPMPDSRGTVHLR